MNKKNVQKQSESYLIVREQSQEPASFLDSPSCDCSEDGLLLSRPRDARIVLNGVCGSVDRSSLGGSARVVAQILKGVVARGSKPRLEALHS